MTGNFSFFFWLQFPVFSTADQILSSAFPPADESHDSWLHRFVLLFSKLPAAFTLCAVLSIISCRSGAAVKMEVEDERGGSLCFLLQDLCRLSFATSGCVDSSLTQFWSILSWCWFQKISPPNGSRMLREGELCVQAGCDSVVPPPSCPKGAAGGELLQVFFSVCVSPRQGKRKQKNILLRHRQSFPGRNDSFSPFGVGSEAKRVRNTHSFGSSGGNYLGWGRANIWDGVCTRKKDCVWIVRCVCVRSWERPRGRLCLLLMFLFVKSLGSAKRLRLIITGKNSGVITDEEIGTPLVAFLQGVDREKKGNI